MTEPPLEVPPGIKLCFVVGARPADAVYPGRPGRRDHTLQVLLFTGAPPEGTLHGLIHLNVATGPFTRRADGSYEGDAELEFVQMLVERCRRRRAKRSIYEEPDAEGRIYVRRESLQGLAFEATFDESPGSYGRDVPLDGTVTPYEGQVGWNAIFDAAAARGVVSAGGGSLKRLECLAKPKFKGWVNSFDDERSLTPHDILGWAQDGPLILVDTNAQQIAWLPTKRQAVARIKTEHGGGKKTSRRLPSDQRIFATGWLSTLIANMLNARTLLPFDYCALDITKDRLLKESTYRERVNQIQKHLGPYGSTIVLNGEQGRGKRSKGEIHRQATCIVVYDASLDRLMRQRELRDVWQRQRNLLTEPGVRRASRS